MPLMIANELAGVRLMRKINDERRRIDAPMPTQDQVALVLHALADHTAIMTALNHRPDPTSPWPEATSVGQWLHDMGDSLES